jgi:hypothetical protein
MLRPCCRCGVEADGHGCTVRLNCVRNQFSLMSKGLELDWEGRNPNRIQCTYLTNTSILKSARAEGRGVDRFTDLCACVPVSCTKYVQISISDPLSHGRHQTGKATSSIVIVARRDGKDTKRRRNNGASTIVCLLPNTAGF